MQATLFCQAIAHLQLVTLPLILCLKLANQFLTKKHKLDLGQHKWLSGEDLPI